MPPAEAPEQVAFIGLGIMGSGMAARLLGAGQMLTVHNRSHERAGPLIERGARWADSPADAARDAVVVFTMLPHPEAVRNVAFGPVGLLDALPAGSLWVDCSTVTPTFSSEMANEAERRGFAFLDAPVSGSRQPAQEGTLTFLVGGDEGSLEGVRPLLLAMGKAVVHAGPSGAGSALKLVFNHLLGTGLAAFVEALQFGEALGLSREMLLERLLGSPQVAPFLANKRGKLVSGDFEADFPLRWMHKDLHLVAQEAYRTGVPAPLAGLTESLFQWAVRDGFGGQDFSALDAALRGGFSAVDDRESRE